MSGRALPHDWPTIYVEARCDTCGEDLFSELFRPAVVERYAIQRNGGIGVAAFWLKVMNDHVAKHRESGDSISPPEGGGSTGEGSEK